MAEVKRQELQTMMRLLCLDHGCWHCLIEDYCSRVHLINAQLIPYVETFHARQTVGGSSTRVASANATVMV
jgi:hypothetical protein